MKLTAGILIILFGLLAQAGTDDVVKTPQEREVGYVSKDDKDKPKPCSSFDEFQKAYEKLIKDNELALTEEKAANLALRISKGCNDSAERFFKAYDMMKKTGVALTKAVEVGLDFSVLDNDRLKNFNEVFAKMYLENIFDFDFPTAYRVSFELSRDYEGKAYDVREDFIKFVKFCSKNSETGLPVRECAEMGLRIVKYTPKFPGGLFSDFEKFYKFARTDKNMGLTVRDAMNLAPKVFAHGKKAPENFQKGMEYAMRSKKINIDHRNALNLALHLAAQSEPVETREASAQK